MASRGINKVILVGNLGQDPDVRYMPNGNAVTNLTLATSESWKDQNGQQQERTEWHRVVIFGKLAQIAGEYLKKGSQVYFEGKLQTRKWKDQQTGQDRYSTEIVVDQGGGVMQMLGGRNQDNANSNGNGGSSHWPQNNQNGQNNTPYGNNQGGYQGNQGGQPNYNNNNSYGNNQGGQSSYGSQSNGNQNHGYGSQSNNQGGYQGNNQGQNNQGGYQGHQGGQSAPQQSSAPQPRPAPTPQHSAPQQAQNQQPQIDDAWDDDIPF